MFQKLKKHLVSNNILNLIFRPLLTNRGFFIFIYEMEPVFDSGFSPHVFYHALAWPTVDYTSK